MTPSEFQILTARCDRFEKELGDMKQRVSGLELSTFPLQQIGGDPDPHLGIYDICPEQPRDIAGSTAKLSDVLRSVAPIGPSRECSCDEPGCNVCNPDTASLSDVLRASVEKESKERTTINECSHGTPPERWVTIRDTTIVDDVERPTESEARDPDVSFLRELADLLDVGDAEYIGRHVPKRLNEIAAKIAYHQKPATPKRATNVKGV